MQGGWGHLEIVLMVNRLFRFAVTAALACTVTASWLHIDSCAHGAQSAVFVSAPLQLRSSKPRIIVHTGVCRPI